MKEKRFSRISKLDWVLFGAMAVFCYFVFQQVDILHTGGSSIGYLNGHFLDFYDYNLQYDLGDSYMPSTYILFAIWNIPIRLLGLVTVPTKEVGPVVMYWYKLLPVLFYFAAAYMLYKILRLMDAEPDKAKLGAFLFLTAPIAFFSQFIFGQYDSFMTFFTLLGFYFWLRGDMWKFSLCFGLAIPFKYTTLLVYVPLLLLGEKRYGRMVLHCLLAAIPYGAEYALYLPSPAFRQYVLNFFAVDYATRSAFSAGSFPVSVLLFLWIAVCGLALFHRCEDKRAQFKWGVFLASLVCFLLFGLTQWHPQWLMFMVPFLLLGMMYHEKPDAFLLIDLLMMGAFVLVCVTFWPNNVDQEMLKQGILGRFIADKQADMTAMAQLMRVPELIYSYTAYVGGLLVSIVFKHPRYLKDEISDKLMESAGLIRLRFLGGVSFFVIPALACFFLLMGQPGALLAPGELYAPVGPVTEQLDVRQYFDGEDVTVTTVEAAVGTYAQVNHGVFRVELYEAYTDTLLAQGEADVSQFEDNRYCAVPIPPTELQAGEEYYLKFSTALENEGDMITIWHDQNGSEDENDYAVVDGQVVDCGLCVRIS